MWQVDAPVNGFDRHFLVWLKLEVDDHDMVSTILACIRSRGQCTLKKSQCAEVTAHKASDGAVGACQQGASVVLSKASVGQV